MVAICTVFVYFVSFYLTVIIACMICFFSTIMCAIITLSLKATHLLIYLLTLHLMQAKRKTKNNLKIKTKITEDYLR